MFMEYFISVAGRFVADPSELWTLQVLRSQQGGHAGLELGPLFLLDQSYKCKVTQPPGTGQTQQELGGLTIIIPEQEARSHLLKYANPAPAVGTTLPLKLGLRMAKEPGLSNSSINTLSTCSSEKGRQSSEAMICLWKMLVSVPT